jgi:hypothetical protein
MPCAASMVAEPRFEFDSGSDEFELRVHGIRVDTIISVHEDETPESLWSLGQSYLVALQESLVGWRFVVTEKSVGVAPPDAQCGDVVCVIDGGVVPFLLRKCSWINGAFQLVGECYVHELMNCQGNEMIRLR